VKGQGYLNEKPRVETLGQPKLTAYEKIDCLVNFGIIKALWKDSKKPL
jgi:hypothetical protein